MNEAQKRRQRKLCKRILRGAPFALANLANFYLMQGFVALAQALCHAGEEGALRHARLVLDKGQDSAHYGRVMAQHERIIQERLAREKAKEQQEKQE
jgi:hypothetical protein